jgi:hypothetical protein
LSQEWLGKRKIKHRTDPFMSVSNTISSMERILNRFLRATQEWSVMRITWLTRDWNALDAVRDHADNQRFEAYICGSKPAKWALPCDRLN